MNLTTLPLEWANHISIIGFLCLFLLVWLIPKQAVYEDAPNQSRWRDIRLWATLLIAIQLFLYAVFN